MYKEALKQLKSYFGYKEFRKGQEEIIRAVLKKDDTLGIMPTGGGKSLCYQVPALCFEGVTVVVSPLISLMKDQIDFLNSINYPAAMINSTISYGEQQAVMRELEGGFLKLLYLTPERFRSEKFMDFMASIKVSLFAVDEAHCISEWGHDFRPEYRNMAKVVKRLNNPPVLALTATATAEVRDDIVRALELKRCKVFVSGFNRENLIYGVQNHFTKEDKKRALLEFLKKVKGAGIVYVSSIKDGEELFNFLSTNLKLRFAIYNGSMSKQLRKKSQDSFLDNKVDVLIATNAFGMGVNKPDIRFVVHYSIPGTIEAYYQETGRAGRDGGTSFCLLLALEDDERIHNFFIDTKNPDLELLDRTLYYIEKEAKRRTLYMEELSLIAEGLKVNSFQLEAVIKQLHFMGALELEYIREETVEISVKRGRISEDEREQLEEILFGSLEDKRFVSYSTSFLAKRLDLPISILKKDLKGLADKKIIKVEYIPQGRLIRPLKKALSAKERSQYKKRVEKKMVIDRNKLQKMITYANLGSDCRRRYLLNYFGENYGEDNCGTCDICRGTYISRSLTINALDRAVLFFFFQNRARYGKYKSVRILKGSYDLEPHFRRLDDFGILKNEELSAIDRSVDTLLKGGYLRHKSKGEFTTITISDSGVAVLKK